MLGPSAPLTQHAVERVLGPPAARVALTREAAEQVLAECRDNQSEAARRLGVSRGKLRRLLGLA
jgi:ActR/RegA family two-component response regulator